MLEEKNDNLQNADGNQDNNASQEVQSETTDVVNSVSENEVTSDESQKVLDEIDNSNAEESEDESLSERHDIPLLDYENMSMETLVSEFEKLLNTAKVSSIREHIEEIRKEFLVKFHEFIDEKREEYTTQNEGDSTGFDYHFPLKQKFDSLFDLYRERKNEHYKSLENKLKSNLNTRLNIIEELKSLVNPETNIPDLFKRFNDIREQWRTAGPIPKDKYNHVWNSYHFHVENFYDYIHLDREARDLDFKHNLEQKQKIVARAKELLNETDLNKVFRELQLLHKLWKEELGPVSREHREQIWQEFSAITKQIHDKRENFYQELRAKEEENFAKKQDVINKIQEISAESIDSHTQWQKQIQRIEALRAEFLAIGKVPNEKRDLIWDEFKNATKDFNHKKNSFYRNIKSEQQDNLVKKQALLQKAMELKDSDDYAKITPIMKQIQEDWKKIGHVPRKVSDSLWKEFKDTCNHFFNRLHEKRNEENTVEIEAYNKKKDYLEALKQVELSGEHKADLDLIKSHIETWKSFGKVPFNKRHIESKYNKILDDLFEKLSLSKKDAESMRYNSRITNLLESDDTRKLNSERIFLTRKIDEIQAEIRQLENNIMFITGAKANNPFVIEVNKNIERHKNELQNWKDKLSQLNQAIRNSQKQEEPTSQESTSEEQEEN